MGAKARLLQYLEYKGVEKPDFYTQTGLSNGYLDKNENMNSDKLEIIVRCYPDLNLNWLVSGVEPMIRDVNGNSGVSEQNFSYKTSDRTQIGKPKDKDLEKRLKDKEEIISALKETINVYRRLVENPAQSSPVNAHS